MPINSNTETMQQLSEYVLLDARATARASLEWTSKLAQKTWMTLHFEDRDKTKSDFYALMFNIDCKSLFKCLLWLAFQTMRIFKVKMSSWKLNGSFISAVVQLDNFSIAELLTAAFKDDRIKGNAEFDHERWQIWFEKRSFELKDKKRIYLCEFDHKLHSRDDNRCPNLNNHCAVCKYASHTAVVCKQKKRTSSF